MEELPLCVTVGFLLQLQRIHCSHGCCNSCLIWREARRRTGSKSFDGFAVVLFVEPTSAIPRGKHGRWLVVPKEKQKESFLIKPRGQAELIRDPCSFGCGITA